MSILSSLALSFALAAPAVARADDGRTPPAESASQPAFDEKLVLDTGRRATPAPRYPPATAPAAARSCRWPT